MTISQFEYKYFLHLLESHIKEGDDVAWNFQQQLLFIESLFWPGKKTFCNLCMFLFFFFAVGQQWHPNVVQNLHVGNYLPQVKSADIVPYWVVYVLGLSSVYNSCNILFSVDSRVLIPCE